MVPRATTTIKLLLGPLSVARGQKLISSESIIFAVPYFISLLLSVDTKSGVFSILKAFGDKSGDFEGQI